MTLGISLTQFQIADLKVILDVGPQALQTVIDRLSSERPIPLDLNGLESVVGEVIPEPLGAAKSILRQALALHGLIKQRESESSPVLEALTAAIQKEASWSENEIARWTGLVPKLNDLLNLQAVHLVSATLDLSYEHENLYSRARILTDIRPMFSRDATKIEAAVVSSILYLRFENIEGGRELSIAMDESDVKQLMKQCERALKKAATARNLMDGVAKVPTVITGEENHD
ncbi:MAG: hypothetical protein ACRED2_10950 [Methylocella sp.]